MLPRRSRPYPEGVKVTAQPRLSPTHPPPSETPLDLSPSPSLQTGLQLHPSLINPSAPSTTLPTASAPLPQPSTSVISSSRPPISRHLLRHRSHLRLRLSATAHVDPKSRFRPPLPLPSRSRRARQHPSISLSGRGCSRCRHDGQGYRPMTKEGRRVRTRHGDLRRAASQWRRPWYGGWQTEGIRRSGDADRARHSDSIDRPSLSAASLSISFSPS